MKKILYLIVMAAVAFGFAACSDQDEVVQGIIDQVESRPVVKSFPYTLTTADYASISAAALKDAGDNSANAALANAVKNTNSLNSFADPLKYIPGVLGPKYPGLGLESAVQVTYAYTPDYLAGLASSPAYTLTAADYASVWGADAGVSYLTPAKSPAARLPAILKAARPDAQAGDVIFASYRYSDQEPNLAPGEELVPIDYTMTADDHQMVIDHMKADPAQIVFVNTQYNNEEFYYGFGSRFNNVSFRMSVRLSGGAGAQYSAPDTELHALDNIPAQAKLLWKRLIEKGMPLYMGLKWPDAKADQELNITLAVYYPNGETNATTNYTLKYKVTTAGAGGTAPVFAYISGADALYEVPPVENTMSKEDHQLVIDAVLADPATSMYTNQGRTNEEWYYGFNAYYGNVSFRLAGSTSSSRDVASSVANDSELHALDGNTEAQAKLLWKRLVEKGMPLYAGLKWPDAAAGQTYDITVLIYYPDGVTNVSENYTLKYRVVSAGSFAYVSGASALYEAPAATNTSAFSAAAFSAAAATRAIISEPVVERTVYIYDGTDWAEHPGAAVVNAADLAAMGVTSLTTDTAPNYLPAFLAQKFPYAQAGDKKAVVYGSTADEYIYTGGVWAPTIVNGLVTEQYVNDGEKWIFDPTVKLTMAPDDYQIMVDWVKDNIDAAYLDSYGTAEYYYGFASFYRNVSFRFSYRSYPQDTEFHALAGNAAAQLALLWKRLEQEGMPKFLQLKYPLSPAIAQGVQLYYDITVAVYSPDDGTTSVTKNYTMRYKVLTAGSAGTPPTFEFVSTTAL